MKQQKPYEEGSVLMDAPQHNDMDEHTRSSYQARHRFK